MRTAAYARYSSDMQRDASLEDQARNIRSFCDRMGWEVPALYSDAAVSGSRDDRPGYRRMLADAGERRFDVLLVDDLSRLSRDKDDCGKAIKRLVFAGVRVIGVSDGVDTARKSHKADVGLRGLMSELYLDDLADKTHRGLTGRALAGASAGGLPYGYRVTEVGQRAIEEAQAAVVRRIFADFVTGYTPREIAARLNAEGVRPARASSWCMTAIYGDTRRGIGILANPIYAGRQVWNRSRWTKHPDTGHRIRKERPESEWIITEHPELAIVNRETWQAAQARLGGARRQTTQKRRAGVAGGPGRPARHLLSGLIRCHTCGGPMVMVDYYRYGCSTNKDRGEAVCANRLRVPKKHAEPALLDYVRENILTDAYFAVFERSALAAIRENAPNLNEIHARLKAAETANANIMAALRAGIITPSTRAELVATERELAESTQALRDAKECQPAQLLPRAREIWRRMVRDLGDVADTVRSRAALAELLGDAIVLREEAGAVYAEVGACEKKLVAGAGYGLWLTSPVQIRISPPLKSGD